jgi:hypothetical protein
MSLILLSSVFLTACQNMPWQKQFSGIQVQMTDNSVSQVYLDGLHRGQTPLEIRDIRPGTYTFRLEPADSKKQPYETQVHLYANTMTSVLWSFRTNELNGTGEILELEPLASKERAELAVTTVPEGANISLGTSTYGLSPVIVDSAPVGTYDLSIEAVAHVKKALAVKIEPGYRLHVFSRLAKEDAALETAGGSGSPSGSGLDQALELAEESAQSSISARRSIPSPAPSSLTETEPEPPYVVIGSTPTGWLRVRGEPSSNGAEVARVNPEEKYPYKSTQNGWYEIEYSPGETGWISGQYADIIR